MNTRSLRLFAVYIAVVAVAMSIAPVEGKQIAVRRLAGSK